MAISRDNFSRRYAVVADTRRQWSDEEKQSIVAEASRPDVNISAVALAATGSSRAFCSAGGDWPEKRRRVHPPRLSYRSLWLCRRCARNRQYQKPPRQQLEDLETAATEDELASEKAAAQTQSVPAFARKRPARKPFPEHLPRERVVIPAPSCCPCCGSAKLSKLGEDITETLEVIPRRWKVIQPSERLS